ncbi:hypothetical protein ACF1AJ_20595 [Leifsonia sp. NPDC014704]|uniref:hypothetical protein n=1 Tax=Leifsonia sp. NPDC014704 TaxID=3364123 RepID=UPI0036F46B7B
MRIRSTRPEFWRSERIASVDWEPRLLLKGLESYVDDNGVGKDDEELIVGDLFQRDLVRNPSRTLARVSEGLTVLRSAGLIHRYSAEGTRLLFVSFWDSIQRIDKPQAGRFPRPDGTLNYKDSVIREPSTTAREESGRLAPGTGEQGNRGTGEQGNDISTVSPVTNVPDRASKSPTDELDVFALEVGVADVEDLRKVLSGTLGHSITGMDAMVFAQEVGKLALEPVDNLTGYVVRACQRNPEQIREWYADAALKAVSA